MKKLLLKKKFALLFFLLLLCFPTPFFAQLSGCIFRMETQANYRSAYLHNHNSPVLEIYSTTVPTKNVFDPDLITFCYSNDRRFNYPYAVSDNATYYADRDGDGFGSAAILSSAGQPIGTVVNNTDTNDFLLTYIDADGDGFGSSVIAPSGVTNNFDCNDANAAINPNAVEICYDGIDNNCDGIIDNGCIPIVAAVLPGQCGQTLVTIDSYVYANLVSNAEQYRFKVTNIATGEVQIIDRFLRVFRITQLNNYEFETAYKVEVTVRINGIWQPFYGTPCTVYTPTVTTQLNPCGITLSTMTQVIYADLVSFATGYRFRVTNIINPLDTQIIDRQLREFRMNLLTGIQYDTQYFVEIAVKKRDGVTYMPYGSFCIVRTPSFPSSFLEESQCNDYLAPSNDSAIFAVSYPGAEGYRFRLQNVGIGYSQTTDRVLRTISLNNFTGLTAGVTYSVKVALKVNGVWGEFSGKVCSVIVPSALKSLDAIIFAKERFEVLASPNPFSNTFAITIQTNSKELVYVKVYNMLGRAIEQSQFKAVDLQTLPIGDSYPAGVYQVIVTQGEISQSLRLIKR